MWIVHCTTPCLSSINAAVLDRPSFGSTNTSLSYSQCSIFPGHRCKPTVSTSMNKSSSIIAAAGQSASSSRTCRNCKQSYDPETNHPRACRFHTAHFGGETKRKFESVYSGGTMDTLGGGQIVEYWHCCGSKDRFDIGCEAAPHVSYDD